MSNEKKWFRVTQSLYWFVQAKSTEEAEDLFFESEEQYWETGREHPKLELHDQRVVTEEYKPECQRCGWDMETQ